MTGGAVGSIVHTYAPFGTAEPGAYALVGMGVLFAGIVRAPMTSVFMIFEITQDYQILVPLMIANLLSFLISRHYQRLPIYEALLLQDNVHLPRLAAHRSRGSLAARDVMVRETTTVATPPPVHVHPDHTLDVVFERLSEADGALPVVSRSDSCRVEGVITVSTLSTLLAKRSAASKDGGSADSPA
jgi:CIC family chloride channel protein